MNTAVCKAEQVSTIEGIHGRRNRHGRQENAKDKTGVPDTPGRFNASRRSVF